MQRTSTQWWISGAVVMGLMAGCQEMALPTGLEGSAPEPSDPALAEAPAGEGDLASQTELYAQRVAQLAEQDGQAPTQSPSTAQAEPSAQPIQQIMWRDTGGPQANTELLTAEPSPADAAAQGEPGAVVNAMEPMSTEPDALVEPDTPADLETDAQALTDGPGLTAIAMEPTPDAPISPVATEDSPAQAYNRMLAAVYQSDDSNLSKAAAAATLAPIGPHGELDWSMLNKLSPEDQKRVKNYHRAVSLMHAQLLSGEGELDREAVASRLEAMYGSQPVTIRKIELCEKVMGYGVYDAFADHTFVAGREQKLIVYVELDNFEPLQNQDGGAYEVRLRQELELYESNGFEVWSHEPVVISDVSQNKRRDFFVVQLVTLPAQLRMGQYHLKVRVYDENGGTRDEASLQLRLVADGALVKEDVR